MNQEVKPRLVTAAMPIGFCTECAAVGCEQDAFLIVGVVDKTETGHVAFLCREHLMAFKTARPLLLGPHLYVHKDSWEDGDLEEMVSEASAACRDAARASTELN